MYNIDFMVCGVQYDIWYGMLYKVCAMWLGICMYIWYASCGMCMWYVVCSMGCVVCVVWVCGVAIAL